CLSTVFLLSGQHHGHRHGGHAAHQLAHNHGEDHVRVKAGGKAQVVAEHKGGRHGKGHVDDLAPVVHVLHHAEHWDVVGQGGHHPGGGDIVHAQQAAQLHQG